MDHEQTQKFHTAIESVACPSCNKVGTLIVCGLDYPYNEGVYGRLVCKDCGIVSKMIFEQGEHNFDKDESVKCWLRWIEKCRKNIQDEIDAKKAAITYKKYDPNTTKVVIGGVVIEPCLESDLEMELGINENDEDADKTKP